MAAGTGFQLQVQLSAPRVRLRCPQWAHLSWSVLADSDGPGGGRDAGCCASQKDQHRRLDCSGILQSRGCCPGWRWPQRRAGLNQQAGANVNTNSSSVLT
jgi:hypothetical protein